ncbi:regulation of enolase protein 1 (concanavalin A-like superfamily) [Microbacterium trichothecenolyticum]|uniref:hypothetical protein n=1 Tax=Microbacterium trichothecenolyticum TaxID=69370 RepID=UPI002863D1C1|nr:hypothetical protein [Microbacterium trichothecenolyticum]MDR7183029.1 regulation of enolase protein 1 (concanavalin A-like superfamily) [Microbacterium trichothecenolyticum]
MAELQSRASRCVADVRAQVEWEMIYDQAGIVIEIASKEALHVPSPGPIDL